MKISNRTTLATLLMAVALPTSVSATTIDFESFTNAANINGINLEGVTITNPSGIVEIFDSNRFGVSFHSATKAIGSFEGTASTEPTIFIFDAAQTYVGLWGGDIGGDTDNWTLTAYDAAIGGTLVGTANSGNYDGSPYELLSITAPSILRVEAVWNGWLCCGVGYDDLQFTSSIPEPNNLILMLIGLTSLGAIFFKNNRSSR